MDHDLTPQPPQPSQPLQPSESTPPVPPASPTPVTSWDITSPTAHTTPISDVSNPITPSVGRPQPAQPVSHLLTDQLNQSPQVPQPAVTPTVSSFEATPSANQSTPSFNSSFESGKANKKGRLKKLLMLIIPLLVILGGGGAAAYFLVILPNSPQNIWHNALINTGKGYDKLVDYSSDTQKTTKGIKIAGSYTLTGSVNSKGTIDSSTYNSDGSVKTSLQFDKGTINFEARSILEKGTKIPDFYFKVDNLQVLTDFFGPVPASDQAIINSINNKWISVDHTYTEGLVGQTDSQPSSSSQDSWTADDSITLARTIGDVNKEWLWTDDKSKAVLVIAKKVGKEKQDNRPVYHYKVTIDKDHTKQYIKALRDKVKASKLPKSLTNSLETDAQIDKDVDGIDTSKTVDVWVDTHTKLPHKVRFTNSDGYVDIGQDYQGGTSFPFTIAAHSAADHEASDMTTSATLDTKANSIDIKTDITSGSNKFDLKLLISQNNDPTSIQKPDGAIPISQILQQIGF